MSSWTKWAQLPGLARDHGEGEWEGRRGACGCQSLSQLHSLPSLCPSPPHLLSGYSILKLQEAPWATAPTRPASTHSEDSSHVRAVPCAGHQPRGHGGHPGKGMFRASHELFPPPHLHQNCHSLWKTFWSVPKWVPQSYREANCSHQQPSPTWLRAVVQGKVAHCLYRCFPVLKENKIFAE